MTEFISRKTQQSKKLLILDEHEFTKKRGT